MKDNRDMFYSDYQMGGYMYPSNMMNMIPNMIPNNNYQTPNNYSNQNSNYDSNYFENRLLKLERATKRLESRVTRLENLSGNTVDDISSTDNLYMI